MTGYLRVVNREKFQHYKKRNPPWIKLYRTVITGEGGQLDDFLTLDEGEQWQLVRIWLLASQCECGLLRDDEKWIRRAIRSERPVPLHHLIEEGWLEAVTEAVASTLLADSPDIEGVVLADSPKIGGQMLVGRAKRGVDVAPQRSTRELPEKNPRPGGLGEDLKPVDAVLAGEALLAAIGVDFHDKGTRTVVLSLAGEVGPGPVCEVLGELQRLQAEGLVRNDAKWAVGALQKRAREAVAA